MLSNLDNEIIFKKAFTNKVVFTQFVQMLSPRQEINMKDKIKK